MFGSDHLNVLGLTGTHGERTCFLRPKPLDVVVLGRLRTWLFFDDKGLSGVQGSVENQQVEEIWQLEQHKAE